MNSSLLAIRSTGAEFANRIFYPVVIVGALAAAILVGFTFWLTTLSSWWWLLFIPIVMLISIGLAVFIILKLTIRYVTPAQTKEQKQATKHFVDKLQLVSETVQTPKVILLFRLVKDIAAPKEQGFIGSITSSTGSLKRDFIDLTNLFKQ